MSRLALVVDDSLTIRKMVSRSLKQAGFEVVEATNGKEGLDALALAKVDIIITDYNMPLMDGLEFIRGVRETEKHRFTPVVFLTTETEDKFREQARAAGATAWIVKPFNAEKVLAVVNRYAPA